MATGEAGEVEREGRTIVRRRWSAQDRIDALAVLASCGGNVEEASRQTGVPPRTLAFWRDRPASGQDRAALAVREELLSQSLERLMWKLVRGAKGKIEGAKLPAVLNGFAVMFDRWKTLRDRAGSGTANAGATGGLNLDALSSEELRTLLALIGKAGGKLPSRELTAGPEGGAGLLALGGGTAQAGCLVGMRTGRPMWC
jgi:hypothetical protein